MADRRSTRESGKGVAEAAGKSVAEGAGAEDAPPELLLDTPIGAVRTPRDYAPLVTAFGGVLDFPAMLAIADILPVMTAFVDATLTYRFVNRPLAQWIGRPRKEILGKTVRELVGDEAFAQREPMLRAALAGERTFYASEFDHPARGHVAIQSDYVPWADSSGQVRGIIILFEDITEQRTTEKALKESEERFRRIANSAPAMMWVTRLDRVRDFVNDHYVEFVGRPVEDARVLDWGQTFDALITSLMQPTVNYLAVEVDTSAGGATSTPTSSSRCTSATSPTSTR